MWIRHEELPDDATVLLHFGAGDPTSVIRQVMRTYGSYRDLRTDLQPIAGCGLFAVSLYAITDEVTRDEIYAEMPHKKVGEATFGQVRELVPVLAASCAWDGMTPEMTHLQSSHYDAILSHPEHFVATLRSTDPSDLDEERLGQLRDALLPALSDLLALFDPRFSK